MANILLVEDNAHNRSIFETALRMRGHDLTVVEDGQAAIDCLDRLHPDLVVLDLSLPKVDGWTVARTIRANPEHASLVIVAVTAHAMKGDRDRALEAGCTTYISKPVSPRELVRTVQQMLDR